VTSAAEVGTENNAAAHRYATQNQTQESLAAKTPAQAELGRATLESEMVPTAFPPPLSFQ
jgi:hypothetical protein